MLTEFLLARIAEDEEAARRANGEPWHHRSLMRHPHLAAQSVYGDSHKVAEVEHLYGWHIALHDPARVLAECKAKRRIVEEHVVLDQPQSDWGRGYVKGAVEQHAQTLRLLALPFADHPDYRQEWKP